MNDCPFGFRIVGTTSNRRRLIDWAAAFAAYCSCDDRAEIDRESYLSAFTFGADFKQHLQQTGSTANYAGECWATWLWLDIDRDDLQTALDAARRLSAVALERYPTRDEDALLIFFSGSKGFHIGIPSSIIAPKPSSEFNRIARKFAEQLAEDAGIEIDAGVYDKVRPFRAPNSRHPKTGLYKRRLTYNELLHLSLDGILQLASKPESFDLPREAGIDQQAVQDWQGAVALIQQETEAKAERRANGNGMPTLNKLTLDFIRNGAGVGDRHRLLFSAAANLAEFGCPPALAHALLSESALDCGLSPKEVQRQIECGLNHSEPMEESERTAPIAEPPKPDKEALQAKLAALWAKAGNKSNSVADPQAEHSEVSLHDELEIPVAEPIEAATHKRQCWNCKGIRFWLSIHGVENCASCVPPASPELVKEWLDGNESEAQ